LGGALSLGVPHAIIAYLWGQCGEDVDIFEAF
jgi:hypothetical protein